jgi:hypothetical protein
MNPIWLLVPGLVLIFLLDYYIVRRKKRSAKVEIPGAAYDEQFDRFTEFDDLHNTMREKGYHYFSGLTNGRNNFFNFNFSTEYNGRGDSVNLDIGPAITTVDTIKNNQQSLQTVETKDLMKYITENI